MDGDGWRGVHTSCISIVRGKHACVPMTSIACIHCSRGNEPEYIGQGH